MCCACVHARVYSGFQISVVYLITIIVFFMIFVALLVCKCVVLCGDWGIMNTMAEDQEFLKAL